MNRYREIFTESHCLSKNQLLGYIQGNLDKDEVYTIESHLNDCSLCSAALEGLMEIPVEDTQKDLDQLKKEFSIRLNPSTIAEEVPITRKTEGASSPLSARVNRWLVAASVLLLIGLGGFSVYSYFKNGQEHLALNEKESKKTSPVEYNAPTVPDNEIAQITVRPEDIIANTKSGKDHVDHSNGPLPMKEVKALPNQSSKIDITEQDDQNQGSYAAEPPSEDATKAKEEVAAIVPEKRIAVDNRNDNAYSEAEKMSKTESMPTAVISKKSKVGGMSAKSNNQNNVSPSNNTNYSNNNNNDFKENSNNNNSYSPSAKYESKKSVDVSDYQKGINFYQEGKYKKAIKIFESEYKKAAGAYKDQLCYYLAQSHYRLNHVREAEAYFALIQSNPQYAKEVKDILGQMERSKTKK